MDSINQNQPEDNYKNLNANEAVSKIKEIVEKAKTCFFCTSRSDRESSASRPMNVLEVDDGGNLWFLSADDSYKNKELEVDPNLTLYFQGSTHSDFLQLEGRATVSRDKDKIEQLWNFILKTWFTEGKNDPRITVIKVEPTGGYYWDNKHGNAIAGIKMLIGASIGRTLDDSIEGSMKL